MKKTFSIEVVCAHCANLLEAVAAKTEGVLSANINFMMQKLTVEFADDADVKAIMKQVLKNCKKIESDCDIEF